MGTQIEATNQIKGVLPVGSGGTGTGTAFTSGSVVFAGASGVYAQDNANFFWDATNHRLGIGTAAPGTPLAITAATGVVPLTLKAGAGGNWQLGQNAGVGSGDDTFSIYSATYGGGHGSTPIVLISSGGNVGITGTPATRLQQKGGVLSIITDGVAPSLPTGPAGIELSYRTDSSLDEALFTVIDRTSGNIFKRLVINSLPLEINTSSGGALGLGVSDPAGTYGAILTAHAATNINFSVRTLAAIAGTGSGVGLDAVTDGAAAVTRIGFRATEFQFLSGKFSYYNSIATAGWGVPAIYANPRVTGQTTAVTLQTFTVPAADSSYAVGGNITITAYTSGSVGLQAVFTDENSHVNTITFAGASSGIQQIVGFFLTFRAKASTTITLQSTGPFVATYNAEAILMQIA